MLNGILFNLFKLQQSESSKPYYIYINGNLLWGGGGEVKSLWSIYVGLHMRYKGKNNEEQQQKLKWNSKNYQSSDCKLELVYMKLESLVIAN